MSSNQQNYAWVATAALALGFGFAFWASAVENGRLRNANASTEIQLVEVKDKLAGAIKDRSQAEAAQTIAESGERVLRDKLAQQTKALSLVTAKISEQLLVMRTAESALSAVEAEARSLTTTVVADLGDQGKLSITGPEIRTGASAAAEAQKEPLVVTEPLLPAANEKQAPASVEAVSAPAIEPAASEKQGGAPVEAAVAPAVQESRAIEPAVSEKQGPSSVEAAVASAVEEVRATEPAASEKQGAAPVEAAVAPAVQESRVIEPAASEKKDITLAGAAIAPAVDESHAAEPAATEKQDAARVDTAAIPAAADSTSAEPTQTVR